MSISTLSQFSKTPFELLRQIDKRARSAGVQVAQQQSDWVGVGASIDGINYVIPQAQVLEVLRKPNTTRVPGSRRWMLGLSNIRGKLFPVIDVRLYCGDEPTVIGRNSRIMLIKIDTAPVAIVVDQVFGFRSFQAKMETSVGERSSPLQEYVKGTFTQDDIVWSVLDVVNLINTGGSLTATH